MNTDEHGLDKAGESPDVSFNGLVGLFEKTHTVMQNQAARSVDIALVVRNWLFGWYIVEFENGGAERAELYGKALVKRLSKELKKSGIKGMSETNLRKFREFYQGYMEIQQTLSVTSPPSEKIQQTLSAQSFSPAMISAALSRKIKLKSILPEHFWQTLTEDMSEEEKLAIIQREFERLYDPNHPVRNHLETLDSVEEVRIIREALKK